MNRLEECLGAAFKREDFGIDANGVVKSGKPLTQRRIRAVCNAAKDFIARSKLDKKFSDTTSLLTGSPISAIIGDERDNGWHGSLSNFSELAVGINDAAQKLRNEGDTQTINEEGVEVTLTLTEGRISASLTIGGETRPVANFAKTKEEIQSAMDKTLLDLYDSFTENWSGSTYGREALRSQISHCRELCQGDLGTTNNCLLRSLASKLLVEKAGVTNEQISMLTNSQLAEFATKLCKTGNAEEVNKAVALAVTSVIASNAELDKRFPDVSALLEGKKIEEIVGGNRDAGWEEKAGDLAVLAAKINRAALTITQNGASTEVDHGGITVVLRVKNNQVEASLKCGTVERAIGNVTADREFLCIAMDDTVFSLYDSFAEKKNKDDVNVTYHGRAVLSNRVLEHYKELSKDSMETKKNCPLRTFAAGLLKMKARVTDAQIAKLTNSQLATYVETLCQVGDASGIKDLIDSAIEEDDVEVDEEYNFVEDRNKIDD